MAGPTPAAISGARVPSGTAGKPSLELSSTLSRNGATNKRMKCGCRDAEEQKHATGKINRGARRQTVLPGSTAFGPCSIGWISLPAWPCAIRKAVCSAKNLCEIPECGQLRPSSAPSSCCVLWLVVHPLANQHSVLPNRLGKDLVMVTRDSRVPSGHSAMSYLVDIPATAARYQR